MLFRSVGTGKTTLCRQIIRVLSDRQGVSTHLLLDPYFSDPEEFLVYLNGVFGVEEAKWKGASQWQLRENIKDALFRQAVEQDRLVVLIVDEGQKMSFACLEILRELLNYETNEHKLLQIIIFGQLEFDALLASQANLAYRVNLHLHVGPLDFQDTRELILARLTMCAKDMAPEGLFTFGAFLAVYLATDGFPRQIVQLCHQALLAIIIKEKPRVTWHVVRNCMRWRNLGLPRRRRWPWVAAVAVAMLLGLTVLAAREAQLLAQWTEVAGRIALPDVGAYFSRPAPPAGQPEPSATAAAERPGQEGAAPGGQTAGQASGQTGGQAGNPGSGQVSGQAGSQAVGQNAAQALALAAGPDGGPAQAQPQAGAPAGPEAVDPALAQDEESGTPAQQAPARQGGPARYTGVLVRDEGPATDVFILTDTPVTRYELGFKANPARIVVEMPGLWERHADREIPVGGQRIDKVRSAVQQDRLRVVVYLKKPGMGPVSPEVENTSEGLRLTVRY